MNGRTFWYTILFFSFLLMSACNQAPAGGDSDTGEYLKIAGETMGTTYHITYSSADGQSHKADIDSILVKVNEEVSTYIPTSVISLFNKSSEPFTLQDPSGKMVSEHFYTNLQRGKEIFQLTSGAFDPTVMPLVNYWGFGYDDQRIITGVDTMIVDSLKRNYIGFDKISFDSTSIEKSAPGVELDFSALAKGYGVDVICNYLDSKGCENYLVEIGGEVRAKGENPKGNFWVVGINTPKEGGATGDFQATIALPNLALATSGNYRNYYQVDSLIFSHTINPATGFPERTELLSASVFAKDCMTADALATACMVMGLDKAFDFVLSQPGVEAYLIYGTDKGQLEVKYTPGLEKLIK
jgi:thiamine biosynthesis lipoprotein